jgi:filamentous hemagglutinin family protein
MQMFQKSNRWGLFIGIAICSANLWSATCANAQITPDGTLPNNSNVQREGNIFNITGGTQAGSNLFHSFGEFSVPRGGAAIFDNATDIQNILSRVTGGSVSNINGIIKANGTANLFLINPSGIIFGGNASLNIGGSFVASTANAIEFGKGNFFSATNPNTPPLLTINPSALLFNQVRAASIENNSVADSGWNQSSDSIARGLRVPNGKSLLLIGGDINMNAGGLYAFGGQVELGGLTGVGIVGLIQDGNNLSLSFPDSVVRSNVSLSNGAGVRVTASNGGSIAVNAQNLKMTGRSFLFAGIETGLASDNSKAGNIQVNATGGITLNNGSVIFNVTEANGQGGDVNISANTLLVDDGAVIAATFATGKGGNLTVDAQNVQLIGRNTDGLPSGLFARTVQGSTGDAGDLTIRTNTLLVQDGAQVSASTSGAGKGGNLTVDAQNMQLISGSLASAQSNSTGNAGDLTIKTNTLLVKDGAQVSVSTRDAGKGGNLSVNAQNIELTGKTVDGQVLTTGLFAASGLNLTGDAGDLTIKTNTLLVKDGAQVIASTFGTGKGGSLTVDAQDVQLIGRSSNNQVASALLTSGEPNSTGNAGDLTIKTNTLLIKDGAQVGNGTAGAGKGGNLIVDAIDVQLIGKSVDNQFPSGLFASAEPNSTGDAGDLTIKTNTLLVKNGAQVGNGTFAAGKGGNLTIDAQDVQLIGRSSNNQSASGLFASTESNSTGDAGDLMIKAGTLLVRDGATVTVQSSGTGTAGNMALNARSIRLSNNGLLNASTGSAKVESNRQQATININSQDLIMSRNSNIVTNARGENVIGGNININTDLLAAIENSDIRADSTDFRGGKIRINTEGLFGIKFRNVESDKTSDITVTGASPELSGTTELNAPEVDPNSGLIELPTVPVDTKVAQGCTTGGTTAKSEFIITGRGGLPPNPGEALNTDAVQVDLITLYPNTENGNGSSVTRKTNIPTVEPIIEATGWVLNKKGEVVLIASSHTNSHSPLLTPASCSLN